MPVDASLLITGGATKGPLFRRVLQTQEPLPAKPPGSVLGHFRLLERIGHGGSADVYRAERCDGQFEQQVAVKVVRANVHLRESALLERQILARLSHPNIARIYDGGQSEENEIWFAMELVEGQPIDAHCGRLTLDWRARLRLLRDVGTAIAHAHQHLVIHRDIKPANIVVDRDGVAKLLDFGISSDSAAEASPTASENLRLTLAFASPEQLAAEVVRTTSDIYQFGLVIEALLLSEDERATRACVPPRSMRRNLAAIVDRATQAEPGRRYSTVEHLVADLERVSEHRPILARSWGLPFRLRCFAERNRVTLSVLAALAIFFGSIGYNQAERLAQERSWRQQEIQESQMARQFLSELFRTANSRPAEAAKLTAVELLERGVGQSMTMMSDAPQRRVIVVETLAESLRSHGERERALHLAQETIADFEKNQPHLLRERGRLWLVVADSSSHSPEDPGWEEAENQARSLFDQAKVSALAPERLRLGQVRLRRLTTMGKYEEAIPFADALVMSAEQAGLTDSNAFAHVLHTRAELRWTAETPDRPGALSDEERSHRIWNEQFGPASSGALATVDALSWMYPRMGKLEDAEALINRTLDIVKATYGEGSKEYHALLASRGDLRMESEADEQRQAALVDMKQARQFFLSTKDYPTQLARVTLALAFALKTMGDNEAARPLFAENVALTGSILGPDHPMVWEARLWKAVSDCDTGFVAEAEQGFSELFDTVHSKRPDERMFFAGIALEHGRCLVKHGRREDARRVVSGKLTPEALALFHPDKREQALHLLNEVGEVTKPATID